MPGKYDLKQMQAEIEAEERIEAPRNRLLTRAEIQGLLRRQGKARQDGNRDAES